MWPWYLDTAEAFTTMSLSSDSDYIMIRFCHPWQGQAKADMVAFKDLKEYLTPEDMHGHIPGVQVGSTFNNRGELAILGLHTMILRGICFK